MKRLRWFIVLPLLLLILGILPIARPEQVKAAESTGVFSLPDGGYYNVPTDKPGDTDTKFGKITIPSEAQKGDGFATKNFTSLMVDFANSLLNFFGLYSIDQLAKSTEYLFWGALDNNDVRIISVVVISLMSFAWILALVNGKIFAVKLAHSSMNSRRKLRTQEFFENWFVGALLLTFGLKVINIIFQLSSILTEFFLSGMPGGVFNPLNFSNFSTAPMAQTGLAMAGFSLIMVGITFALNFIYLQRYVLMLVYAGLSPFFFTMYFYDATRERFWNWIKNLMTLAAMPAAHSFMMWIYTLVTQQKADNYLLRLVFLLLFISITEVVLNFTGFSAGTGGMSNHVLTGLGLGITLSGMRGVGGMFAAIGNGGGTVDSALSMRMGMNQMESGMGRPGTNSVVGGGANSMINTAGALSGSNARIDRTQAFKDFAKNVGSKTGSILGGMGGALMGAGTGNMGMMSLGGVMGSNYGGKIGGAVTNKAAGVGAVQGQILGEQIKNRAHGNQVSRDDIKENLFGAGPNLPSELDSLRPSITKANMAGLQGGFVPGPLSGVIPTKQSRINQEISQAMASAMPSINITPQEGDRAFSRAYADHTEFYYQPEGKNPMLVDYTTEGDKMAGMNRAVETVQEYRGKKNPQGGLDYNWQDVQRVSVDANSNLGSPGVPWNWNTRKSILQ